MTRSTMDGGLFLSALRARFPVFALALIVTVAAATIVSLVLPESYESTASVVVDTRNEQSFSEGFNLALSARERAGYIQTQVDIITSKKVARRVVENLKLSERPGVRAFFTEEGIGRGSVEDWLADRLLRQLEVDTSQSSVINITFVGRDPEYAASVANGFAEAYMDTMLELQVEPTKQAASWFDEQLETLRADLHAAQARLTAYQQRHDIVSSSEQLDIEHQRLTELSMQLLALQDQTRALRGREEQARQALEAGTPLEYLPEVQVHDRIRQLRSELLAGQAALQRLSTTYGANHPEYRRQTAENGSRRQLLEDEMRTVLQVTQNSRRESERREAEVEAALAAQRQRLLGLNGLRDELDVLTGDVQTAQNAYDTAMERYVISQVESRARQANVQLLNAAVAPSEPYAPNIPLNIALSVVIGTLLGAGLIVVMEMSDRRVRTVTDMYSADHIPVLGTLDSWIPPRKTLPLLPAPPEEHGDVRTA